MCVFYSANLIEISLHHLRTPKNLVIFGAKKLIIEFGINLLLRNRIDPKIDKSKITRDLIPIVSMSRLKDVLKSCRVPQKRCARFD